MRRTLSVLTASAALLVGLVVGVAGPADAASTTYADPPGDGDQGDRLDILGGTVDNRDHALVVTTSYARVSPGHLVVFVKTRGTPGTVRLISFLRRGGGERHLMLGSQGEKLPCDGLRVRWDTATDTSRVRMPARCLHEGDYGAVRVGILTEDPSGADADSTRRTDWIARG